uniref:Uncharacterized protein n=1 Tax=Timema bartmani TaxID=61472 RepID=A0A7R9ENM1_9NEOP|nr:unnamed protein product [Timema bartmani]
MEDKYVTHRYIISLFRAMKGPPRASTPARTVRFCLETLPSAQFLYGLKTIRCSTLLKSYPEHACTVPTNQYPYYKDSLAGQYTVSYVTTTRRISWNLVLESLEKSGPDTDSISIVRVPGPRNSTRNYRVNICNHVTVSTNEIVRDFVQSKYLKEKQGVNVKQSAVKEIKNNFVKKTSSIY